MQPHSISSLLLLFRDKALVIVPSIYLRNNLWRVTKSRNYHSMSRIYFPCLYSPSTRSDYAKRKNSSFIPSWQSWMTKATLTPQQDSSEVPGLHLMNELSAQSAFWLRCPLAHSGRECHRVTWRFFHIRLLCSNLVGNHAVTTQHSGRLSNGERV